MAAPLIHTQNRVLVTVSSMPGDWAKLSGVGGKQDAKKLRPSAGAPKVTVAGEYELGDITTTRLVNAVRDADLLAALNRGEQFADTTVTEQFIDEARSPVGRPLSFSGCRVTEWQLGDADANGDGELELTVTWAVAAP